MTSKSQSHLLPLKKGLPGNSVSKEPTCNAGDPGWIPGLESSPGEGIGYPLQYSWASLVAQMVNNLPAIQETWVWSLGWEDSLKEDMATHSSILAWGIPIDRVAWWDMGSQRVGHDCATKRARAHTHIYTYIYPDRHWEFWIIKKWASPGRTNSITEGRDAWLQYMRMSCPWKCWGGSILNTQDKQLPCRWVGMEVHKETT